MNVLPMIALSTAAIGFFGAVDHTDRKFDAAESVQAESVQLTAYAASPHLSVHELLDREPQSVEQPFCDTTNALTANLEHDFAETAQASWAQGDDINMQLWASDVMATWTLLHVGQDGIACVVSSGIGWTADSTKDDILAMADIVGA